MRLLTLFLVVTGAVAGPVAQEAAAGLEKTEAPAPRITSPPQLRRVALNPRDELVTKTVTSCYNYVAATMSGGNGCSCEGIDHLLPQTSSVIGGTTSYGCGLYSTVVDISKTVNPYPFTKTYDNSATVAYATTQGLPAGAWLGAGASTTIKAGKQLTMELNPSASQNVGTLTGEALYTSISSALSAGCGTVAPSSTMATCEVPTITGINYVEDGVDGVWHDGSLSISIPFMSVTDNNVLQALISSIAGAFMASSTIANNSRVYFTQKSQTFTNLTNVAALAQAIYTDDVSDVHSPQNLGVALVFSGATTDSYLCDAAALAGSALYYSGFVANAIGLIPGFEWAEVVGLAIEGASVASEGAMQAVGLTCELKQLTGSK